MKAGNEQVELTLMIGHLLPKMLQNDCLVVITMTLVKEYRCEGAPRNEEIQEGIKIASTEHCIVVLRWFIPYSGHYKVTIKEGMSFRS